MRRSSGSTLSKGGDRARVVALAVGFCLLLGVAPQARAEQVRLSCGIAQLTRTLDEPNGSIPVAIDREGSTVLFLSRGGPGGFFNLFRMDLASGETQQLTSVPASTFPGRISASGDLSRVVFRSSADLTGENPGGQAQLFLLDTLQIQFHQLTQADSSILESGPEPVITGDGGTVLFSATGNPLEQNEDLSPEVFSLDLGTLELSQLTDLSQASEIRGFSVSRDGQRVVYQPFHPLSGFSDIVLVQRPSGTHQFLISGRNIALPLLSGNGKRVFFVGREDFTDENPDRSAEIFSLELEAEQPLSTLQQLTDFPPLGSPSNPFETPWQIEAVGLSPDGSTLAFRSPVNLLGISGHPASSLFVLDVASGSLNQFPIALETADDGVSNSLFLDESGHLVLTGSRADPAGENADRNRESFLASCQPATTLYLPQVGSGVVSDLELQTSFMFAATDQPIAVQIEFFDQAGNPLVVDLGDKGKGSYFSSNLNRGRSWILETVAETNRILVGWARVSAGPGLTGTGVFSGIQKSTGTYLYEAAVPLTEGLTDFSAVVTHRVDLETGLAFVNPPGQPTVLASRRELSGAFQPAVVIMRLYDSDFLLLEEVTSQIGSGQHQARFIGQIFQSVAQKSLDNAMLTVHSSRPLAAVALRQRDDPYRDFPDDVPTLTTFPVAPGTPDPTPEQLQVDSPF